MLPRVLPSPRRGETGRHPCGAPQARLMAFGRQGVTGAERSRDGTARFDRLGESHVEKPRDDDTLADGSTCGGATGRSRPRDPPTPGETEPNRTGATGFAAVEGKPRRLRRTRTSPKQTYLRHGISGLASVMDCRRFVGFTPGVSAGILSS